MNTQTVFVICMYFSVFFFAAFFTQIEVPQPEESNNQLIVAVTSDKGLCGGVHSAVCKSIKALMNQKKPETEVKLLLVGDKANQMLTR